MGGVYMLYIPRGIKANKEIITGFGKEELIRTLLCFVGFILVGFIVLSITKEPAYMIYTMILGAGFSIIIFIKDPSGLSIYNVIRYIITFYHNQQVFVYRYNERWSK